LSPKTGKGSTNSKKRWRSQKKKLEAVTAHIRSCLQSGGKTFDQLYEGLSGMGISDHYFSDVLRDLLLWEHRIEQRLEFNKNTEEEERIYLWR
jgi:hypothetical protein